MSNIIVTLSTFGESSGEPLSILDKSGFTYSVNQSGRRMLPEEVVKNGKESVGIIAGVETYSEETLKQLPQLRAISRVGVGIDNIDLKAAERLGIRVVNTPDEPADAVAELTVVMMLALLRRLPKVDRLMHEGNWERITGGLLKGRTIGVVGLGRIGKRVVQCLQGFGVRFIGADLFPDIDWCQNNGVTVVELNELLSQADIVTLHASGGIKITAKELSLLKRGSFLLNLARGEMVDDEALADSLIEGHLAGAALDVFPNEPYAGRLLGLDNVVLSPHQSTLTRETRSSMETNAVHNLLAAIS